MPRAKNDYPESEQIPHPFVPGRDITGRMMKGHDIGHNKSATEKIRNLQAAFIDCVTPDDMRKIYEAHLALCLTNVHGISSQLHALSLFYDRVLGKPINRVAVDKQTNVAVTHSLDNMSLEDLRKMETILSQYEDNPTLVIEHKPEGNAKK